MSHFPSIRHGFPIHSSGDSLPTSPQELQPAEEEEDNELLPEHRLDHDRVLDYLEREFLKMDTMYERGEMSAFGRNSDEIFEQLDRIREQQMTMASSHIALEMLEEDDTIGVNVDDAELIERDRRKADRLDARTVALQKIADQLDRLGDDLSVFHDLSNQSERDNTSKIAYRKRDSMEQNPHHNSNHNLPNQIHTPGSPPWISRPLRGRTATGNSTTHNDTSNTRPSSLVQHDKRR
ncbi:hypothetical protein BDF22DRAFT_141240 [Syncephalis plumigaleata]|nr:hypothetical protein BDF22DRAFT_141240 [Syncephalis plumigaleata]